MGGGLLAAGALTLPLPLPLPLPLALPLALALALTLPLTLTLILPLTLTLSWVVAYSAPTLLDETEANDLDAICVHLLREARVLLEAHEEDGEGEAWDETDYQLGRTKVFLKE